jgi:hypothetical protein
LITRRAAASKCWRVFCPFLVVGTVGIAFYRIVLAPTSAAPHRAGLHLERCRARTIADHRTAVNKKSDITFLTFGERYELIGRDACCGSSHGYNQNE